MKLGLFVPVAGDPARLREIVATAATVAERCGFHSIWFAEHVALFDTHVARYPYSEDGAFPLRGEAGLLEPFTAIAFAAAASVSRMRHGSPASGRKRPSFTAGESAPDGAHRARRGGARARRCNFAAGPVQGWSACRASSRMRSEGSRSRDEIVAWTTSRIAARPAPARGLL